MPHMPDRWNDKKQMQFDGLSKIGTAIAELEDDTGFDCGFRRCGRLMPIVQEQTVEIVRKRIAGAAARWPGFSMELIDPPLTGSPAERWLNEAAAPHGATHDTLSGRVDPRSYVGALAAFVRMHGDLLEGVEVAALEPLAGRVRLANGGTVSAAQIVVAAGWEAYSLLQPFMGHLSDRARLGQGIKGQAVLLAHDHDDTRPIIYDNGTYIVPQARNRIAIGSTTRADWQSGRLVAPEAFDTADMEFYDRAMELAPSLAKSPIVERWAAVRPRNRIGGRGTEPWFGRVPEHDNVTALIGGFKISFGLAHIAASS